MTRLTKSTQKRIVPSAPFNFDKTFFKPDHFPTNDCKWIPGVRWQTIIWNHQKLGVKFSNSGSINEPEITIDIFSDKTLSSNFIDSFITEIRYRYNLDLNLKDFYSKVEENKGMAGAIKNLNGMRPGHSSSLYEYLIIGIILQNATVKRSIQMFQNLLLKYGDILEFDNHQFLCMWDIGELENVTEEELRSLKIGYRAKSLLRLDEQFGKGLINENDLRKAELLEQKRSLLSLYGVGLATVWYLLFDIFHHWDIFEHISPWEHKLYSQVFFNRDINHIASIEELMAFINQFGEYKHLAVHYLWEDLWWRRQKGKKIEWLENEIRQ